MTNFSHCAPVGLPVVGDRPPEEGEGQREWIEKGERWREREEGCRREERLEGERGGVEGERERLEGEKGGAGEEGRHGGREYPSPPVPSNSPSP